jgi:hypothetical protein
MLVSDFTEEEQVVLAYLGNGATEETTISPLR